MRYFPSVLTIVFLLSFFYFSPAQVVDPVISFGQSIPQKVTKIDSMLSQYYQESIKEYLDEIGEFRVTSSKLRYWGDFFDNRIQMQYEQPLS
ncbi:MAG: hypothetical protein WAN36_16650, partial [Calditrichia bacterium]